jgi:phage repressor protein C with HTH and peptisase S24 domain
LCYKEDMATVTTTESLAALCDREGGYKVVAKAIECNPQTLYQVLAGIPLPSGKPRQLGRELISRLDSRYPGWLTIGEPPEVKPPTQHLVVPLLDNDRYPSIRRVRFKLQAGASGFGVEYLNEDGAPMVFHQDWFRSRGYEPSNLFAVKVSGASMEPGLFEGDVVVVNTAQVMPKDGQVFAVNYEGEMVVKRLHRDAGHWWLRSDNTDKIRYSDKQCHAGVFLLGEVVHKQSEHI